MNAHFAHPPPFFCSLIFAQVLFGSFDGHGSSFLLHAQTPEIVPLAVKLSLARCFDETIESCWVLNRPGTESVAIVGPDALIKWRKALEARPQTGFLELPFYAFVDAEAARAHRGKAGAPNICHLA